MSTLTYSCPNCGAHVEHEISTQGFHCDYCSSDFTLEQMQEHALKKQETGEGQAIKDYEKEQKHTKFQEEAVTYQCKQCGAEIVSDKNTVSTFCLYCHSPNIIQARLVEDYTPDKVIPFQIDQDGATNAFKKWTKGVHFLPDGFAGDDRIQKISGLYAPFWLFSAKCRFHLEGIANKVTSSRVGNVLHKKTDFYNVAREGYVAYTKVPVDASKSLDNNTMEQLEPFNYDQLKDFDMAYLSGHYAEKYDDEKETLYPPIEAEMKRHTQNQFKNIVNKYDTHSFSKQEVSVEQEEVNYTFLPIWFLNYQYQEKEYAFTMNGQTGKIIGKLPIDRKKQVKLGVLLSLGIFVGLLIIFGGSVVFS